MTVEIKLPVLGENVESATVVRLLIKPGDMISRDQPIMELERKKPPSIYRHLRQELQKEIQVKEGDTSR
jgi:pyruvate dehydrogenase E2 component (dihydrolipoamide acetyltransferase)